jgi:hypothetical protein
MYSGWVMARKSRLGLVDLRYTLESQTRRDVPSRQVISEIRDAISEHRPDRTTSSPHNVLTAQKSLP